MDFLRLIAKRTPEAIMAAADLLRPDMLMDFICCIYIEPTDKDIIKTVIDLTGNALTRKFGFSSVICYRKGTDGVFFYYLPHMGVEVNDLTNAISSLSNELGHVLLIPLQFWMDANAPKPRGIIS